MATDQTGQATRPLAHCPADCTCRGMAGSPRATRQTEQARDNMPQDEYDQAVARALALMAGAA